MSAAESMMERDVQGYWLRLETLTRVRWLAIGGQGLALVVAWTVLGLRFEAALALAVVGVSVLFNALVAFAFPRSRRLSELEAVLTLMFDTAQLALLLFLTGGLTNPFALLLLAPATIGASALKLPGALAVAGLSVALATLLALVWQPLRLPDGGVIELPELLRVGFWLAIVIGVAFLGVYARSVALEKQKLAEALLATQMALAREQKLTDLGGVVAAAAHELGTPLATIKLASAELAETLTGEAREDALLIRDQADRCRTILRSMGSAGKRDEHLRMAPLETVLREAAAPHTERGKQVDIQLIPPAHDPRMPDVWRSPEVVHGLRNLIQNAVDFAAAHVRIEARWSDRDIEVTVSDDGPGYPPNLLDRLGEPWLRSRPDAQPADRARPGYEGMGLGLFIAKTLLERSGARVRFANRRPREDEPGGARAQVTWPLPRFVADSRRALGENQPQGGAADQS